MPGTLNFQKVGRNIKIFAVVQVGLVAMLVYMAIYFQAQFQAIGRANNFLYAVVMTFIIQLAFFYPINKFAGKEADRDLSMTAANLSTEEIKALTKKKRYGDIIKISALTFFVTFLMKAPNKPIVMSVLYFSFILTILTYLQCYNFAAKRQMKQNTTPQA